MAGFFEPITFNPSTSFQTWKVPAGITKIHVDCVACRGYTASPFTGGKGGRVQCDLKVTPGQTLYLICYSVNYYGTQGSMWNPAYRNPAYNASDIRTNNAGITDITSLQSRLVVAGAGGNCCSGNSDGNTGQGGAGGGLTGGTSSGTRGVCYGGTQSSGGTWTAHSHSTGVVRLGGYDGSFGIGGQGGGSSYGGEGGAGWTGNIAAGAGGAGWYGGAGGQASEYYGRVWGTCGGGGSSYTNPNLCFNVIHTQGYNNGSGYIIISMQ